jgi:hypothetical protein
LKWRKRLTTIALGGASRLLSSFSNVIISFFIIRNQTGELWGELISYLLILDFGFSIISWGATPYLIREFSLHPNTMKMDWSEATSTRSLLLLLFNIVLIFIPIKSSIRLYLMAWSIARFLLQSIEPIMLTNRHFILSLCAEAISILSIVLLVICVDKVTVETLLLTYSSAMALKALLFLFVYRNAMALSPIKFDFFKQAFPFLLLSFSGMLQQRVDLFCVAYFLGDKDTAVYQVYISFLLFAQFGASLVLSPYSKNIFRLSSTSFLKLERNFIFAGVILSSVSIVMISIIVQNLYHFSLSWKMYLMGYLYILMFYIYLLRNYELGKLYKQIQVSLFSFASGLGGLIGSLFLTPIYGIEGALFSGLLAQILLALLYHRKNILIYAKS